MSDAARWELVKELLDRALDLTPSERRPFLERECGDRPDLLDEVSRLLDASEPAWDILEGPAVNMVPSPDPDIAELEGLEGTTLDSYRLVRLLGTGGMGVVYEAERTGELTGRVAVKLIKRGMDSAVVARRFRYERQILARLTHPNIAHFIDGGVAEEGQLYFVMELVDGEPITSYSTTRDLTTEARVRLFLQVLEAVGFAHKNLVVHRDVKPSNVLVTPAGGVKLLDFGVAKVLGDEDQPDATITRVGGRVLTPSYSSPEQIRGEPVTTAADVYSLGVVLYELLAGQKPFDLDTQPLAEVQRIVSFDEPTRPSAAVTTGGTYDRAPRTRRLSQQLSGDLDAIVLKALRKEPEHRYSSAKEFHDDLCRFLDGLPVLARRGTIPYRTAKFVRRYRAAAALTVFVVLTTVVGGGFALRGKFEADRQRALAEQRVKDMRKLVNALLFEVHDEVAALPGSTGARKLLLDKAYEQLQVVREDLPDDPQILMELAEAYRRLGDVQGHPIFASLGDLQGARVTFEEGLALAHRAIALDPQELLATRSLGLLHERYASVLVFSGDVEAGVEQSRKALDVYEQIAAAYPDSVRHQFTRAIGTINLSDYLGHPSFPNLGRPDDSEHGYRAAQTQLTTGILGADDSFGARRYRALVQERLGRMLREKGDLEEATEAYRASTHTREGLFAENPTNSDVHRDVAIGHQNLCILERMVGDLDGAIRSCAKAATIYEARVRADSVAVQTLRDMAMMSRTYEELFHAMGDTTRMIEHLDQVIFWSGRALARDSTSVTSRENRLDALLTLGLIEARRGTPVTTGVEAETISANLALDGQLSDYDAARLDSLRALTAPRR